MPEGKKYSLLQIREALEASWDKQTSYQSVAEPGNPALGQCYPTSRVVQFFFPETEIVKGRVRNGDREDIHFWNTLRVGDQIYHVDLSWQQFPTGSSVIDFVFLDRNNLGDGQDTIRRCNLLRERVSVYLKQKEAP